MLVFIISIHCIISFTHKAYGRVMYFSNIASKFRPSSPRADAGDTYILPDIIKPPHEPSANDTLVLDRRANATFVILARNSDIQGTVRRVREIEDRFNRKYCYLYVLLIEEPFTDEFKKRVSVLTSATMEFGVIPRDHWFRPEWIDGEKAKAGRDKMAEKNIIYGVASCTGICVGSILGSSSDVWKYRWYWRIEPDVHFHCDTSYDPFLFMEDKKVCAFTITMYEYEAMIPTLWGHAMEHPEYITKDNALGFMSTDNGKTYHLCHFWSNFEIANMAFWRGPAYTAFFEYLDKQGGIYYERCGDALVHSIATALLPSRDQIQFFDDIGYEHNPYTHCPKGKKTWDEGRCSCDQQRCFDYDRYSCMSKWDKFIETR